MSVFENKIPQFRRKDESDSIEQPLLEDDYEEIDVSSKTFNNIGLTFLSEACGFVTVLCGHIMEINLTDPVLVEMGVMSQETCNDITRRAAALGAISLLGFIVSSKSAINVLGQDKPGELLCD